MGSPCKRIPLLLVFLNSPCLLLPLLNRILTILMMLSLILLPMLMILPCTLSLTGLLICGNNFSSALNSSLTYEIRWIGLDSSSLISELGKLNLFHLIIHVTANDLKIYGYIKIYLSLARIIF